MPSYYCFDDQLTVGELLDRLGAIGSYLSFYDEECPLRVRFDFVHLTPVGLGSYWGYYEDLALHYGQEPCHLGLFHQSVSDVVGTCVTGWKGGNYRVKRETPVWVANPSEAGGLALVGVERRESTVYLLTKIVDD